MRQIKRDPKHKNIIERRDTNTFVNDDNFGQEEGLEIAIDKRKFLMKRLSNACNPHEGSESNLE